jgi:uncharacterized protein
MRNLTLYETRVIGCLIEKSLTTPDQYPLSLNALTNACNQKSNREPVLELADSTVQTTVDDLIQLGCVTLQMGSHGRVAKYQHRFCNTEFSELRLTAQELAIMCMFFLRGAQTPGELRTRTQRLYDFKDVQEVELTLHKMLSLKEPLVVKLPIEPGRREVRYWHKLSGDLANLPELPSSTRQESGAPWQARIDALEQQVDELRLEVSELRSLLDGLTS